MGGQFFLMLLAFLDCIDEIWSIEFFCMLFDVIFEEFSKENYFSLEKLGFF